MARRQQPTFINLPPIRASNWTITIDGLDVRDDIFLGKFVNGIIGEEQNCEIELDNGSEKFTGRFSIRDIITFSLDFADGTTVQWKGELEEQQKKYNDNGYMLNIKGAHFSAQLLDKTVIAEFSGAAISDVLKSVVADNLPGFTTNNVETISDLIDISFNNKPVWDIVLDLMALGDADCYVDEDKDFHFFKKESKTNNNEVLVIDDGLLELQGLGPDSIDVRNKTIVYGEAGGLTVVATSEDTDSQAEFGTKERIVNDSSITDESEAQATGNAENEASKDAPDKGTAESLLMPTLSPGDKIFVDYPPQEVHSNFRVVSFMWKLPNETMEVNFSKKTTIPKLFKDRQQAQASQERVTNPLNMKHSFNFTFDNESKIDTSSSNNVEVVDSELKLITGVTGFMQSNAGDTPITATAFSVSAIGDNISGNVYLVSFDDGVSFQSVGALDTEIAIPVDERGVKIILKITLNSAAARLDATAVYYK